MDCVVTCMIKMWIMPLLALDYLTSHSQCHCQFGKVPVHEALC